MTDNNLTLDENNYVASKPNALQHGILSKHLLLQWENAGEYNAVIEGLQREYTPEGMTEQHLVEELAGIIWRKRRLRIAEAAHYQKEIPSGYSDNYSAVAALSCIITKSKPKDFNRKEAMAYSEEQNLQELEEIKEFLEPTEKAQKMLDDKASYEKVLAALANVTREWWVGALNGGTDSSTPYKADAENLARFLKREVLPFYIQQYEEALYRPLVKNQTVGEAFMPNKKLETFTRYEVFLDRKMERTLTVLLRLQEMRKNNGQALPPGQLA